MIDREVGPKKNTTATLNEKDWIERFTKKEEKKKAY